jgi:hypothetical protein
MVGNVDLIRIATADSVDPLANVFGIALLIADADYAVGLSVIDLSANMVGIAAVLVADAD